MRLPSSAIALRDRARLFREKHDAMPVAAIPTEDRPEALPKAKASGGFMAKHPQLHHVIRGVRLLLPTMTSERKDLFLYGPSCQCADILCPFRVAVVRVCRYIIFTLLFTMTLFIQRPTDDTFYVNYQLRNLFEQNVVSRLNRPPQQRRFRRSRGDSAAAGSALVAPDELCEVPVRQEL